MELMLIKVEIFVIDIFYEESLLILILIWSILLNKTILLLSIFRQKIFISFKKELKRKKKLLENQEIICDENQII